jgi:hypothetical protein
LLGPLLSSSTHVTITELVAKGAVTAARRRDSFSLPDAVTVHSGARIDQLLREVRG